MLVCAPNHSCSKSLFVPSFLFRRGVSGVTDQQYIHFSSLNISCLPVCIFNSYDQRMPSLEQVGSVGNLCQWLNSHGKCPDFIPTGRPKCPESECQGHMQAQCSPIECGPPRTLEHYYSESTTMSYLVNYEQNPRLKTNYYHHKNAKRSCLPCCPLSSNNPQKMPSKSIRKISSFN